MRSPWSDSSLPTGFVAQPPLLRQVMADMAKLKKESCTANQLERLNKELKRRTRVATSFPNEASLLRLAGAVLIETSEEWETGKIYLTLETK